jgi:hypothetical protein
MISKKTDLWICIGMIILSVCTIFTQKAGKILGPEIDGYQAVIVGFITLIFSLFWLKNIIKNK